MAMQLDGGHVLMVFQAHHCKHYLSLSLSMSSSSHVCVAASSHAACPLSP